MDGENIPKTEEEQEAIAQILRESREDAGFTQEQVAYLMRHRGVQVSQQRVSDWERGKTQPRVTELRLFQALVNSRTIKDMF